MLIIYTSYCSFSYPIISLPPSKILIEYICWLIERRHELIKTLWWINMLLYIFLHMNGFPIWIWLPFTHNLIHGITLFCLPYFIQNNKNNISITQFIELKYLCANVACKTNLSSHYTKILKTKYTLCLSFCLNCFAPMYCLKLLVSTHDMGS